MDIDEDIRAGREIARRNIAQRRRHCDYGCGFPIQNGLMEQHFYRCPATYAIRQLRRCCVDESIFRLQITARALFADRLCWPWKKNESLPRREDEYFAEYLTALFDINAMFVPWAETEIRERIVCDWQREYPRPLKTRRDKMRALERRKFVCCGR